MWLTLTSHIKELTKQYAMYHAAGMFSKNNLCIPRKVFDKYTLMFTEYIY